MANDTDTPAMAQWRAAKNQHPDKLIWFRMGDFYELFHDDAVTASRILGIALTTREKGENPTPMAGVPHSQLDRYLRECLDAGLKAAIVDQLEDPAQAKGVVRRGITRVLTPGTLVEESCLPSRGHNFLAAIARSKGRPGLALVDASTGDFYTFQPRPGPDAPAGPPSRNVGAGVDADAENELSDEIARHAPSEILIAAAPAPTRAALARQAAGTKPLSGCQVPLPDYGVGVITERPAWQFDPVDGAERLKRHFGVARLDAFGLGDTEAAPAIAAAGAALAYLEDTQPCGVPPLRPPRRLESDGRLALDRTTQRHLELVEPMGAVSGTKDGDRRATLLAVLDHTRTAFGTRLLRQWILSPLARLEPLLERQQAVAELMRNTSAREEIRGALAGLPDLERITARLATGRASPADLASVAQTARRLPAIRAWGINRNAPWLTEAAGECCDLDDVAGRVETVLVDSPPPATRDGGIIRDHYHPELDELRRIAKRGKAWIADFQAEEQEKTGIPSLKVGYNRVFGYFIEITRIHHNKVPRHYERKQTLSGAERYVTPELKTREQEVLGSEERAKRLEHELFAELRDELARSAPRLQQTAHALARLDAIASLAEAGARGRWVMPVLREDLETEIIDGRHPVLEAMLPGGAFVPNDAVFRAHGQRILLITGPNMAGKSTYLRQTALIALLAQTGSAVPAKSAEVGLVDRIFTRIGAADDLARGRSTFMVEMSETAHILHHATERSLVLLDEVGRGTSTFDGVSLAWAITEWLHDATRARVLFATHYHELTELGRLLANVKNFNVAVREWEGEVVFMRRIEPGACDKSYGIHVARLAGMPTLLTERAEEILRGLESRSRPPEAIAPPAPYSPIPAGRVEATEAEEAEEVEDGENGEESVEGVESVGSEGSKGSEEEEVSRFGGAERHAPPAPNQSPSAPQGVSAGEYDLFASLDTRPAAWPSPPD